MAGPASPRSLPIRSLTSPHDPIISNRWRSHHANSNTLCDGTVAVGFADKQKVRADGPDRLADGLFRIDVVAQIARIETAVTGRVQFEPATQRSTLTVLLVVTLLRFNEFRP